MGDRVLKQLIIGLGYLIIFGMVGYGLFAWIRVEPTCTDRVQNQGEEGVDCGAVCGVSCAPAVLPLEVGQPVLIPQGAGTYDVVVRIVNPNASYGASKINYRIEFTNAAGTAVAMLPGTTYALPGQPRYLVRTAVRVAGEVAGAHMELGEVTWQSAQAADGAIDFPVRREGYGPGSAPGASSEYQGVLFNDSDFDFERVDVAILLFDAAGRIIGANATTISTFLSRTERAFVATWTAPVSGKVARQQVDAVTNVFENANFIRRYGSQEKFQEF